MDRYYQWFLFDTGTVSRKACRFASPEQVWQIGALENELSFELYVTYRDALRYILASEYEDGWLIVSCS